MGMCRGSDPADLEAHFDGLAARASTYLTLYWPAVETVAAALLANREPTGWEVEELVQARRSGQSFRSGSASYRRP
jgi:hypothetical protein